MYNIVVFSYQVRPARFSIDMLISSDEVLVV